MKNSSAFSYTLSAFVLVAVLAAIAGYLLGSRSQKTSEGFASGNCNVCDKPKVNCKCQIGNPPPPAPAPMLAPPPMQCPPTQTCPMCQGCKPSCGCPQKAVNLRDSVGPDRMNAGLPASISTSPCPVPDPTKYVLKATIPPCPPMPDMSRYMLKTECPNQPDMSKYVLKSSVPKCPPCISTCSKPCKIGECPPCPRPRCPTPNCPDPKPCPACPSVQVQPCAEPRVQCKAAYEPQSTVRPMLASTSQFGL
uniref:Uncharacterized protein n=1 Tax=viral metagenome TaxID=1070528 RepID=A0A6C0KZH5_9ZZZZ